MSEKTKITEAEYEIMKALWSSESPLTVSGILAELPEKNWTGNTVATLLKRLCDKGAVEFERKGKTHYYYPALKREDYNMEETRSFLSKIYNGSVKNLVASLYTHRAIPDEEIDELRRMFDLEKKDV